ncbi:hypothetical protein SPRG_02399 [Saprolegnia parasitica CBS 223.65]|uniref:Uncharacterized protein n=1 Tax=Saprolegnia parasitica (strain CBS 223.65) TaxID=695850 RepID=A0A067CPW0_SAPPC|nr:hypothetical protein SPRG_02399 [Saprolegnia parasitica CBS 223.65]KDO32699.1 hypothetical protein SPRG_02399 [Saprolegnia parasitica CBS 223.65]|eukprot:XP_012196365.1 hypothetical protein SPRG_02399 [Saprolegnia parasitica CBS 223.65]
MDPVSAYAGQLHDLRKTMRKFKDDVRMSFSMWSEDMEILGGMLWRLLDQHQGHRQLLLAEDAHAAKVQNLQDTIDRQARELQQLQGDLHEKEQELATRRATKDPSPVQELRRSQRIHASAAKSFTQHTQAHSAKRKSTVLLYTNQSILKKLRNDDDTPGESENRVPKQVTFQSPGPKPKPSPRRVAPSRKPLPDQLPTASSKQPSRVRVPTINHGSTLPPSRVLVPIKQPAPTASAATYSSTRKRWS